MVTSSLSTSNIVYTSLLKPSDSGRVLSQAWIIRESSNNYRLRLEYSESLSALDITAIAGIVSITEVSTASS